MSLLTSFAFSAEQIKVNMDEVASYAAQKYRVSLDAQPEQGRTQLVNEYFQTLQIANALSKSMQNDVDLKVITKLFTVDIWAKKFIAGINPTDEELKKIFELQKPQSSAKYNLRNILVKDEISADKIIKELSDIKEFSKELVKFKEFVKSDSIDPSSKSNEGEIGFIEANKLDQTMLTLLKDKKAGDIVKINIPQIGYQILLIEEYQPEKMATFEESKQLLITTLRQEALKKEIDRLILIK
jgi:parvulin-like peptidyl-prolyl isomerase